MPDPTPAEVAALVRSLRERAAYFARDLAAASGLPPSKAKILRDDVSDVIWRVIDEAFTAPAPEGAPETREQAITAVVDKAGILRSAARALLAGHLSSDDSPRYRIALDEARNHPALANEHALCTPVDGGAGRGKEFDP